MDTQSGHTSESVAVRDREEGSPRAQRLLGRGVYRRLLEEGHRFRFSQAIRLLELAFPEAPSPGQASSYRETPIRFRPSVDLAFPPTDLKQVEKAPDDRGEVHVVAYFFGLYGIDSPLPYHFYDQLAQRPKDTKAHRDFLDIFNHRLYAFFYRAWKKYRPALYHSPGGEDHHSRRFVSLAGIGTPRAPRDLPLDPMRLAAQAGVLASRTRNAAGLEMLVEAFFGDIGAEVIENVPRWVPIPSRSGLGDGGLEIGGSATIGERIYDRSSKFRLRLGPMNFEQYLALLPGGEDVQDLKALIRLGAPDYLEYDVQLQVPSETLPETQLGRSGAQLGFTTSAGEPKEDVFSRVVDYGRGDVRSNGSARS